MKGTVVATRCLHFECIGGQQHAFGGLAERSWVRSESVKLYDSGNGTTTVEMSDHGQGGKKDVSI
jgi:hypothetical protein